jgi:O-antigen/teichoic acid export membrane protein
MWGNAARLLDVLATAALLLLGQPPLHVCLVSVLIKAVLLLAQTQALRPLAPELCEGAAVAEAGLFKRLLRPSLAFMVLPLGNALALQGPLLILGHLAGAEAVAMFSAMRTLARVPVQLANALNASLWPEISRAWGERALPVLRQLHRKAWAITAAFGAAALAGQCLLGGWASQLWLGPGHHNALVLNSLALAALVSALWNVSSVVLAAINAHTRFTAIYLGVNALALAASIPAYQHLGMPGLLACQVLPEALMAAWVWPEVLAVSGDKASAFATQLFSRQQT